VRTELPPDLPWVLADAVLIEQVLENLIENAIKYTAEGTPITLGVVARDTEIEISVADRGPGLAPGEEKRVFDKFYRTRAEGSQSGVGLGLTICRAVVEAHGGRIRAERNSGGGAVFRFVLPRDGEPPRQETESGSASP
jgi:two-component system sensor histidine kinase KdpD